MYRSSAVSYTHQQERKQTMDFNLEELEDIIFDRAHAHAECGVCGHSQDVEPDADYPCPECGKGRLVSPLRQLGMI